MARRNSSLVRRLVGSAVMWALPALAFAALSLTWFYRNSTYRLFDERLESTVTVLMASAENRPGAEPLILTREPVDPDYQRALSGRYWMIDGGGRPGPVLASRSLAGEALALSEEDRAVLVGQPGASVMRVRPGPDEGETVRILARSIILPGSEKPIIAMAAADSRQADRDVRNFGLLAVGLMLLLTAALITAVYRQVRVGLAPLFDLRDRVADIREGRADHVDGQYPREIQPLATELNSLMSHNRTVVEQAKTHVSNLAHALKTPLAVLLNEAGGADTVSAELVTRQSETMKRQVDHHLQRARAAARGQAIGVSTSVAETLEPIGRTLPRIYRDKDMALDLNIPAGVFFRGEKRDLEEMAGNLMDNACKWTSSLVTVTVGPDSTLDSHIQLVVEDNGPGIAPEDREKALKRGERLDEATPGTGFGLAIVDDLARAYKGSLRLETADSGGLRAFLSLPGRIET